MTKKDMIIAIKDEVGNSADDVVERAKFLKAISEVSDEEAERWKRFDQAVTNYCISHKTI